MVYFSKNKIGLFIIVFSCIVFSCKNEDKTVKTEKEVEYIMYQPSEMAGLMNAMYVYNAQLKQDIIDGKEPTHLPLDLMQLHKAEMTDGKDRSEAWNSFVNLYINAQQAVVDSSATEDLITRYNATITNCLGCHKTECTGPIPKIRKLLIQ